MSATDIFRSRDTTPIEDDGVVRATSVPAVAAQYGGQRLPGMRRNPMDVVNTRGGMPNPTGRRP
jgi:hypothetical protein